MATGWSNNYNVIEIKDFSAKKMAVDYTGSIALLAGQKKHGIVEIYKSSNILHQKSYTHEINATEWNQTHHNQHICALAYSHQLHLLCWENNADLVYSSKLSAHTHTLLDINWHSFDPNTLASASLDSFVHIWDIRKPSRPALSLESICSASKVRWNHLTKHMIATAHDGNVKIWDQRNVSHAVEYITAHSNSIQSLDWSYINENQLVTCSQDCTVKIFEINNLKKHEIILNTVAPVWRVKCTPNNDGILIVLSPPDNTIYNNLLLWNLNSIDMPVHTFIGHSDTILECEWLKKNGDKTFEYEMITWSQDHTIRLWHVMPYFQKTSIKYHETNDIKNSDIYCNAQSSQTSNVSNDVLNGVDNKNSENEIKDDNLNISSGHDFNYEDCEEKFTLNLHQEFFSLNVGSEVFIEQKDPNQRLLIASIKINNNSLSVHMTFPQGYPVYVEPQFQITKCTYDSSMINKIHKVLHDAAVKQVAKKLTCVQYCLRELILSLRKTRISFSDNGDDQKRYSLYSQSSSSYDLMSIYKSCRDPCNILQHKTMGLKFSNNGTLLFFNNPPKVKTDIFTPISQQNIHSKSFLFNNKNSQIHNKKRSLKNIKTDKSIIVIYDVSCLFPINLNLASKYKLDINNVVNSCLRNAQVTNKFKRRDLVKIWLLAAVACNTNFNVKKKKVLTPFLEVIGLENHPFTAQMIESLISHYAGYSDFQTAALLCCVVDPNPGFKNIESDRTPTPVSTRSNSPIDNFSQGEEDDLNECFEVCDQGIVLSYCSSTKDLYYNEYKRRYIDILGNLGLLDLQAKVKKCLKYQNQISGTFKFKLIDCNICSETANDEYCLQCQEFNLKCSLCNSVVRGTARICLKCGHGGHDHHLTEWFKKEMTCALNCGCFCQFEPKPKLNVNLYNSQEDFISI